MATNVPSFAITPKGYQASLTTASGATDAGLTAPSNVVLLGASGASGTYWKRFKATGRGALIAGLLRLFIKTGANYVLLRELVIPVSAAPSATQTAYDSDWQTLDLNLPSGSDLYVSTTQTHNVNVIAEAADY